MTEIVVPRAYKHELRKERKTTEDYMPQIRYFIEASANKPIRMADFEERLGTSGAIVHIKRLMKLGYITRSKTRGKGKNFAYKWHAEPLTLEKAALKNGDVVVTKLDLPDLPTIDNIREMCIEWFDDTQPSAEQMAGALLFRKFVENKIKEVKQQRVRMVKEARHGNDRSTNSINVGVQATEETE